MADNLEKHQRTLDFTDNNARAEHDAYAAVATALRNAAIQLRETADRMSSYRDLPMPRHDASAITSPEIRDAFATFIERERDLSVLLNTFIQKDRAILGGASVVPEPPAPFTASLNAEAFALRRQRTDRCRGSRPLRLRIGPAVGGHNPRHSPDNRKWVDIGRVEGSAGPSIFVRT